MKIPSCHHRRADPEGGVVESPPPRGEEADSNVDNGVPIHAAVCEPNDEDRLDIRGGDNDDDNEEDGDGRNESEEEVVRADENGDPIGPASRSNGTHYLAALHCFKKHSADNNDDDDDDDISSDRHGVPYSSLNPTQNENDDGIVMDADAEEAAPTEVPTSSSLPSKKKAPWARRSTSTTLATSDEVEDDTDPLHDGSDSSSQENDDAAGTAGARELRDVEKDDDDDDDDADADVERGAGVEVTVRQYMWKQRWDRFYYGFLKMRRAAPVAVDGCYAAPLRRGRSEEAKFVVGDDDTGDDNTPNWQRKRRRWAPILISLGVATVLLVAVAVGSACGSGQCGTSSSATAASAVTSPGDNSNNSPPGANVPSTTPSSPSASIPSPSSAPAANDNNNIFDTEVPTVVPPITADNPWTDRTPEPTWAKTNPISLSSTTDLYCYPSYSDRTRYSNVWGGGSTSSASGYTVEAKEGSYCGPGNNHFTAANVNLDSNDGLLVLQYRQVNGRWTGSEVRVVLPDALMPYTYGTYSFSVRNVSVTDMYGQPKNGNLLSEDLVVGFFTWDDTENYNVHENWNHEVDVELSRWMDASNEDAQFVIQPPEVPHYYRFFSGLDSTVDPGGQTYQFTWYPTNITWHASKTGESYAYTTRMALEQNLPDRIQCLPANVEVRMNVWNVRGADVAPTGMADTDVAQVVIDKFSFVPSNVVGVDDGQLCSKHCQCSGTTSMCVSSMCTPQ
jgi:hypothetical protein